MAKKDCFVIAPVGDPESETRKRSDQVLKHVISPAAEFCGYKSIRADKISEPGMITSQVIQHIVDDQLVIADLTERNPNVFYELAIRHAIRKPLVQLIQKGEQIPFDVAGTRTIHVDHHDLDSVEEAKKDIIAQIKSLEADASKMETPISVSLDLQLLKQSDNPEERSLADVLSVVAEIRHTLTGVEEKLSNPEALLPPRYLYYAMERHGRATPSGRRQFLETRNIVEKLNELLDDSSSHSAKSISDYRNRLMELKDRLNYLVHSGDFSDT